MDAKKNLDSQQHHLTAVDYDLRITNLARFIGEKLKPYRRNKQKELKMIDIGAGSGLMIKHFMNLGYEVAGIELDPKLVAKMKKDKKLKGLRLEQGDITKLKGKEEYDVVVSNDVIEHIEDDRKAIKNLWTFVKPGGMLIITVPAHSFLYCQRDEAWGHFRRYDRGDLVKKVAETTGTVKFITYWNFIGFFVYLFMEKLLKLKMHEEIRYKESGANSIIKKIIDKELQMESHIGGTPIGLSLVVGVKKEEFKPI